MIDESSRKGNDISDELEESEPLADVVSVVYPVAAAAGCGCTCRHGLRQPTFCFSATALHICLALICLQPGVLQVMVNPILSSGRSFPWDRRRAD